MRETWVWSLVWEDPTCRGATKPRRHNYWACEPPELKLLKSETTALMCCNFWSLHAWSLCSQEKPQQWEARTLQLECSPCWSQLEKSTCAATKLNKQPKTNKRILKKQTLKDTNSMGLMKDLSHISSLKNISVKCSQVNCSLKLKVREKYSSSSLSGSLLSAFL